MKNLGFKPASFHALNRWATLRKQNLGTNIDDKIA